MRNRPFRRLPLLILSSLMLTRVGTAAPVPLSLGLSIGYVGAVKAMSVTVDGELQYVFTISADGKTASQLVVSYKDTNTYMLDPAARTITYLGSGNLGEVFKSVAIYDERGCQIEEVGGFIGDDDQTITTHACDMQGRPLTETFLSRKGAPALVSRFVWTADGRRMVATDDWGAVTRSSYDARGNCILEKTAEFRTVTTYVYDRMGNWTTMREVTTNDQGDQTTLTTRTITYR
jgi:hypothetical protein